MDPLRKYAWLIDTIRRAGMITFKEISDRWQNNKDLSDGKPLSRATFNHWRDTVYEKFSVMIDCQRSGGYLYYISNPEEIEKDKVKKWMLDSFAVSNTISDNLALRNRIIVDEIPSGRDNLVTILEAMKESRILMMTYKSFNVSFSSTFTVKPYCLKLFENRWYLLGINNREEIRIYGLDRMEKLVITDETFRMPKDFSGTDFFATKYGVIVGYDIEPERIVVRAFNQHQHYMKSLPLHPSQRIIKECEGFADFEYYLSPTYDFVMKLLYFGARIEVLSPPHFRETIKGCIADMAELYED